MHFPVAGINAQLLGQRDQFWVSRKMRPTQFATKKNRPGIDYAKKETSAENDPQVQTILALKEYKEAERIPSNHENLANVPKENNESEATS